MFNLRSSHDLKRSRRLVAILSLETFEDRTVPAVGIGTLVAGVQSGGPPFGNSGAAGPNDYVNFVTGGVAFFSKFGDFEGFETDVQFWTDAGIDMALSGNEAFEPHITYDPLSERWFVVEMGFLQAGGDTGNQVLLARSDTSDPLGPWKAVSYTASTGFSLDPTLGVDANGVYIGTIDADALSTFNLQSVTMTSIPKADLLVDNPTLVNATTSVDADLVLGWNIQGATNFNSTADHASIVGVDFFFFDAVDRTPITGTDGAFAQLGPTSIIDVEPTSFPNNANARQPDGSQTIDPGDDRFSATIYQVGDLIYMVHAITVDATGQATFDPGSIAVRLTVISDSTDQVVAEGTWFDPDFDYTYPSIAVNSYGDMLIGFSRSGPNAGAGPTDGNLGAYAVYARIDPNNPTTITFGPEIQIVPGFVDNYHQQANPPDFWGNYSATTPDPSNPLAFWTTQEFAVDATTWATAIAQVFVSPRAQAVSSPTADGSYGTGSVIDITVSFNNPVTVTGTPQLALNTGGTADYTSGSGTSTLTFSYTVAAGQSTTDLDYLSANALTLNGGTIVDAISDLDAELVLPAPGAAGSLGANKNIAIDTQAKVTGVTSPLPNGRYGAGTVISITVLFNQSVVVTGTPQLALNTGAVATYSSGSGTNSLTFTYTVAAGQTSADLDYTSTSALTLNGGTIQDEATGQNVTLTLPAPGTAGSLGANKDIVVDTTAPHVTAVDSTTPDGSYGFGAVISITITFHKAVSVTGTPQLALNSGGMATYASGNGTTTLTFTYTVGSGNLAADLDYLSTTALTLNGGSIVEASSGLAANLTLPAPGAAGSLGANADIAINAIPPAVTVVTSPTPNGLYPLGAVIDITIQFNKAVNVTGSPQLALNSGGTAVYLSGSGTTTLTFRYTVGSGEVATDLDYASASALSLNGGTIQEASGLDANLTLPAPGTAGSLGANKNISVDTVGPTILQFRVLFGTKWFDLLASPRTVMPWQVKGIQVVFSERVMTGNLQSLSGITATKFTGLKTNTLTWNFPVKTLGSFIVNLAAVGASALKDAAGNPIAAFSHGFDVLYGDFTGDGHVNAADEAGVRANIAPPFQLNPGGYNVFADLNGDGIVNAVDVGIARARRGSSLPG